jgi:ABC-type branched-subunit amino acid transport system ATPase component
MFLETRNLRAGYEDFDVLRGVDLGVKEGQIVCVIGPNGAGKSTLFRAIFGQLTPREGVVTFKGRDITNLSPQQTLKAGISYVLQRDSVFSSMTVEENLRMGAYISEDDSRAITERIAEMYDLFPVLEEKADQNAGTLSGGQRQMVEFARGLMLDPDLLLLDEPTAGLAPKIIDDIFARVEEINASGVTVLMIEQNIKTGLKYSDYAYVLERGQTAYHGPAETVIDQPEIAAAYLGDYVTY